MIIDEDYNGEEGVGEPAVEEPAVEELVVEEDSGSDYDEARKSNRASRDG
jgi:hypothetical protein